MTSLVNQINVEIAKQESRISALEKLSATSVRSEESLAVQQTHSHSNQKNIINSELDAVLSIKRLIKNALDKDKRKCNVIIFNLPDRDSFYDDKLKISNLMYDLELDECMIEAISRIGKFSTTKSRPLRLQLRSELCFSAFLKAAYLLKFIKRKWPKVGISPDRTPEDIKVHQNLMKEFRQRREKSEEILIVGKNCVR